MAKRKSPRLAEMARKLEQPFADAGLPQRVDTTDTWEDPEWQRERGHGNPQRSVLRDRKRRGLPLTRTRRARREETSS